MNQHRHEIEDIDDEIALLNRRIELERCRLQLRSLQQRPEPGSAQGVAVDENRLIIALAEELKRKDTKYFNHHVFGRTVDAPLISHADFAREWVRDHRLTISTTFPEIAIGQVAPPSIPAHLTLDLLRQYYRRNHEAFEDAAHAMEIAKEDRPRSRLWFFRHVVRGFTQIPCRWLVLRHFRQTGRIRSSMEVSSILRRLAARRLRRPALNTRNGSHAWAEIVHRAHLQYEKEDELHAIFSTRKGRELRIQKKTLRIQSAISRLTPPLTFLAALFMILLLSIGLLTLWNAIALGLNRSDFACATFMPKLDFHSNHGSKDTPPAITVRQHDQASGAGSAGTAPHAGEVGAATHEDASDEVLKQYEAAPHRAMILSLTGLEMILLAPLPYLLILSLQRYIRALAFGERAEQYRKELIQFKSFECALFIAILAAAAISKALEPGKHFTWDFALAITLLICALAVYYFLIERQDTEPNQPGESVPQPTPPKTHGSHKSPPASSAGSMDTDAPAPKDDAVGAPSGSA